MKKVWNAVLSAGILACILCACGGETESSNSLEATQKSAAATAAEQTKNENRELPDGYVLSARFQDAGGEKEMRRTFLTDSSLYFNTSYYDQKKEVSVQELYVQEEGEETECLMHFGDESGKSLVAWTVGEDGSLYFLCGIQGGDGEPGSYLLEKRDPSLQEVYSVDVTGSMEDTAIYDMAVEPDGRLYGVTLRGSVLCWDEKGAYQGQFSPPKDGTTAMGGGRLCFGLANAGETGVYAYWGGRDEKTGDSIFLYDLKKWMETDDAGRETQEPLRVDFKSAEETLEAGSDDGFYIVFNGNQDGIYMADQNRLWQIDVGDGSLKALLAWRDVYLKAEYVEELRRQEDGGFLAYIFDTLEQENYWVTMEPLPETELPEKKELVLGVAGTKWYRQSLASRIDQVVLSYNRTHPECQVTIKEYEESSITNFQLELLKGEGPDILLERQSFFDMEELADKGAVENLAPYLEKGEEVSAENILPGIRELITKEGKISRIPLSFAMDIMILPKELEQDIMTPQEVAEYMSQGEYIDYMVWPESLLLQMLSGAEMDHYVAEEEGSCSFNGEEFVGLLEELSVLKNMEMIRKQWERAANFRAGQLPVMIVELDCLEDYLCIREALAGSGRVTGFPNSSGELRYPAKLYDWIGINSASQYKEDAWDFIVFCLSYVSRCDDVADRFVVTDEKFEKQTCYEREGNYFIKWNEYDELWTGWQEIAPTTQEDTELLREMSEHLYLYEDDALMQVIEEETAAFFAGDISAREAAERIQNRAALVLGE